MVGITTLAPFTLTGCSTSSPSPTTATSAPARTTAAAPAPQAAADGGTPTKVFTSAQLRERLLDEADLGQGHNSAPSKRAAQQLSRGPYRPQASPNGHKALVEDSAKARRVRPFMA